MERIGRYVSRGGDNQREVWSVAAQIFQFHLFLGESFSISRLFLQIKMLTVFQDGITLNFLTKMAPFLWENGIAGGAILRSQRSAILESSWFRNKTSESRERRASECPDNKREEPN